MSDLIGEAIGRGLSVVAAVACAVGAVALLFDPSVLFSAAGDPPPPPTRTQHEGRVSRVVVEDPRSAGWNNNQPNPQTVVLTVGRKAFDLAGELRQAATVKPGDTVVIDCVQYDTWPEPSCSFGGIVIGQPTSKPTP